MSSRFKGISRWKNSKSWGTQFRGLDGKMLHFGSHATEECAAKAYDRCVCCHSHCARFPPLSFVCHHLRELRRLTFSSALYKVTGDASGPNCGPLSEEEQRVIDDLPLSALKQGDVIQPHAKGSSSYRGVGWRCV